MARLERIISLSVLTKTMDKKILAIVQARFGSTRLPGKVLKDIEGKPMLWHIAERLKHSKHINQVVIATTTESSDDRIADFAESNKLGYYRGSVMNVLDRFYQTAKKFSADVVVRIWGDCVMIDPDVVDKAIELLEKDDLDYASNIRPPSYPRGMDLEVFTFATLEKTWKEATTAFYQEYMTDYIFRNPQMFKLGNLQYGTDLSSQYLLVDYEDDFRLASEIYKEMFSEGKKIFGFRDVLELLQRNPKLKEMNKGLKRYQDYLSDLEKQGMSALGWDKHSN